MTASFERVDLFTAVHKGLRAELFAAAQAVGRADFLAADEAARTAARVRRMLGFVAEHGEHEDAVVLPELFRIDPIFASALRSEHARLEGAACAIARTLERIATATAAERAALGRRLHEQLGCFLADQLRHMEREETEASRLLWAHRTDDQLGQLRSRIVASIPAPRHAEWLGVVLPAINASERAALHAGLRSLLAPEVLAALVGQSSCAREVRR